MLNLKYVFLHESYEINALSSYKHLSYDLGLLFRTQVNKLE